MDQSIRQAKRAAIAVAAGYLGICGVIFFLPNAMQSLSLFQGNMNLSVIALVMALVISAISCAAVLVRARAYQLNTIKSAAVFVGLMVVTFALNSLLFFALYTQAHDWRLTLASVVLIALFIVCLALILMWVYRLFNAGNFMHNTEGARRLPFFFLWIAVYSISPFLLTSVYEFFSGGDLEGASTFGFLPLFFSPVVIVSIPIAHLLASALNKHEDPESKLEHALHEMGETTIVLNENESAAEIDSDITDKFDTDRSIDQK